jgi:hypothetical protein
LSAFGNKADIVERLGGMNDHQFRAIALLIVVVMLLGFIAGLQLGFAWQHL